MPRLFDGSREGIRIVAAIHRRLQCPRMPLAISSDELLAESIVHRAAPAERAMLAVYRDTIEQNEKRGTKGCLIPREVVAREGFEPTTFGL